MLTLLALCPLAQAASGQVGVNVTFINTGASLQLQTASEQQSRANINTHSQNNNTQISISSMDMAAASLIVTDSQQITYLCRLDSNTSRCDSHAPLQLTSHGLSQVTLLPTSSGRTKPTATDLEVKLVYH